QTTSASTSAPHPRPTTSTTVSGSLPSLPQPPTPSSSSSSLHSSPRRPSNPTAPPAPEPSSTLSTSSHVADSLSPIRGGQRRTSLRKRSIQDMSVSPQRSPRMLPHPDTTTGAQGAPQPQKRFFILKSLTNDDLDISVKSGVWATQPHNEPGLNRAFKNTETVYLIFSANKSGEFYGFARGQTFMDDLCWIFHFAEFKGIRLVCRPRK
ncbi:YT521-B-like domain-containing protein, partial [Endogone sp. FLAS-F59071]